jgi:hypothetical protein
VQFEYKASDTDEQYRPGDELRTKWGDPLPSGVAAEISYLLLRYGDTHNPDEAAALAHLLHSWTAPPRTGHDDLNPRNDFRHIAYDAAFHLGKLPPGAQRAARVLSADAEANRGPWTASVTTPAQWQTIGTPAGWTVTVHNARGAGLPKVPVRITLGGATLPDGTTETVVSTGDDGTATVPVIPTGAKPALTGALAAPSDTPYVGTPVEVDTQRVVSTGGERELATRGTVAAYPKRGIVLVTKLDAKSGKGIAGARLRLTGKDKTTAALGRQSEPLLGTDGAPVVLTTEGDQGRAAGEVQAPQQVCLVEVGPPPGTTRPSTALTRLPPAARSKRGATLTLTLTNTRTRYPPPSRQAGAHPPPYCTRIVSSTSLLSFLTLGGLALAGSALVGLLARRRSATGHGIRSSR